jgi:hypothetical protein
MKHSLGGTEKMNDKPQSDKCRMVAVSIPDEVIDFFFNLPILSSRIMALEFTQPLTEMSTRNPPGG